MNILLQATLMAEAGLPTPAYRTEDFFTTILYKVAFSPTESGESKGEIKHIGPDKGGEWAIL